MENVRINVGQAHSDTYNGNPYIAFAGIMTGLLSVILFVDELDAVSFTVVGVLLFSGIYAYILSYAHYNKRKFLPFVIVGEVVVMAILSVFNIQRISEQSVSIMQALVDGRANTQNVTYVVFVSSVVLIYIIYLLEIIFKNRVILTLVTVVMLAASPILRLEVSLFHIFVIAMHTTGIMNILTIIAKYTSLLLNIFFIGLAAIIIPVINIDNGVLIAAA